MVTDYSWHSRLHVISALMKVTNTLTESITMNLEGGMRHKRDINNHELKNVMGGEVDFVHFAFRL